MHLNVVICAIVLFTVGLSGRNGAVAGGQRGQGEASLAGLHHKRGRGCPRKMAVMAAAAGAARIGQQFRRGQQLVRRGRGPLAAVGVFFGLNVVASEVISASEVKPCHLACRQHVLATTTREVPIVDSRSYSLSENKKIKLGHVIYFVLDLIGT